MSKELLDFSLNIENVFDMEIEIDKGFIWTFIRFFIRLFVR